MDIAQRIAGRFPLTSAPSFAGGASLPAGGRANGNTPPLPFGRRFQRSGFVAEIAGGVAEGGDPARGGRVPKG